MPNKRGSWYPGQWDPRRAVLEKDMAPISADGAVKGLVIHEHSKDLFYVTFKLTSRRGKFFLSSQRDPDEPRMFRMLNKLLTYLKEQHPTIRSYVIQVDRRRPARRRGKEQEERRQAAPKPLRSTARSSPSTPRRVAIMTRRSKA